MDTRRLLSTLAVGESTVHKASRVTARPAPNYRDEKTGSQVRTGEIVTIRTQSGKEFQLRVGVILGKKYLILTPQVSNLGLFADGVPMFYEWVKPW